MFWPDNLVQSHDHPSASISRQQAHQAKASRASRGGVIDRARIQKGKTMDPIRTKHIVEMFNQRGADFRALVCRIPQNIVMLTGYLPILGNSFCLVTLNHDQKTLIHADNAASAASYAQSACKEEVEI